MGQKARQSLQQCNAGPDGFSLILAASGGPRWVGLVGIDRVLARYLKGRNDTSPLPCLGASSGAWRLAALSADQNGETYEELLHEYIEQSFEGSPTPEEISRVCRAYLARLFTPERVNHSLNNPNLQLNFTTAIPNREYPGKTATSLAMARALAHNGLSREKLGKTFQRGLFSVLPHPQDSALAQAWDQIPTVQIELTQQNFRRGIMATGSIPMILEGESSIPGSPRGHHLDGGVLDYHFEIPQPAGPVLYPHFSADPIPGWLDRFPPYRRVGREARDWLCLILPSDEMLARYPTGDYPNRHHFKKFSNPERKKMWRQAALENEKLEAELTACLEAGDLLRVAEELRGGRR